LITFVVGPHRGHDEQAKPPWRFSVNLNSNCFPYAIVKEPSVYLVCPALSANRADLPSSRRRSAESKDQYLYRFASRPSSILAAIGRKTRKIIPGARQGGGQRISSA